MSWIKDNKFLVALLGGTLLGTVLLYLVGSKGADKYTAAKEEFDSAAQQVATYERLPLYPKRENLDAKRKALDEYRQQVGEIQDAFAKYRPEKLENISPGELTNRLKAANEEIRKAFDDAQIKVPDPFFAGFETYKTSLASGDATGILNYELGGIRHLLLALAKSGATELKNFSRQHPSDPKLKPLEEEDGRKYSPPPGAVARPLSMEVTFQGPEKALRAFLTSIAASSDHYFVIRSLRVTNMKKDPPRAADARFDKPAAAAAPASDVFAGGFVLPGDEAKPEEAQPAAPAEPAAPEPADSSRILAQVLGNEEVQVFLRLDLMQFLPAQKLP